MTTVGDVKDTSPSKIGNKRPSGSPMYSPRKKSLLIERYLVPDLSTVGRGSYSLEREIEQLEKNKMQLHLDIVLIKTELEGTEQSILHQEDQMSKIKEHIREVEKDIKLLDEFERESIEQIEAKSKLKTETLFASHGKRLNDLKESLTQEIDEAMKAVAKRDLQKAQKLEEAISKLEEKIKATNKEKNRRLILLKEDHGRSLHERKIKNEVAMETAIHETALLEEDVRDCELKIKQAQELLNGELQSVKHDLEKEIKTLEERVSSREEGRLELCDRISSTEREIKQLQKTALDYAADCDVYGEEITALSGLFPDLERKRRLLHSQLHDLKGNIRVFCRIRPDSSAENSKIESSLSEEFNENGKQDLVISKSETTALWNCSGGGRIGQNSFQFDKVFDASTTNSDIFKEWCQLVQCALDGSRVCVFAYGQTGSGKTHTMSSGKDGMIPLSLRKIFDDVNELASHGWAHTITANFIEIYNEAIIDLFGVSGQSSKHEIKHDDESGTTNVTNLKVKELNNLEEALELLRKANARRATASTDANERSSRSHSVLTINLKAHNTKTGESRSGILNLIDLAGSERIKSSGATGARLKETQAINKSLSCLGDVIHSLARRNNATTHIPYRNSKLTYLLKNSLQGNSKTLMFINVLPLLKNYGETINSLRFATKVNNTKVQ